MVLATTLTVEVDSIVAAADSAQQHDLQTALSDLHSLQSVEVTTQLLSETEAGKKIRKLTKHRDAGIAEASKSVLAKWKECVRQEQEGQSKRPSDCELLSSVCVLEMHMMLWFRCCLVILQRWTGETQNHQVPTSAQGQSIPKLAKLQSRMQTFHLYRT